MASYTSSQTGNWNTSSTWGGAGVPTDGDDATIADTHTVTVTENATIGLDSGTTAQYDLEVLDGGALIIDDDITLTTKTSVRTGSGPITLNEGASWITEVGTGDVYQHEFGTGEDPLGSLYANGTSSNYCTISKTGDGTAVIDAYHSGANGDVELSYTNITDMGSASLDCFNIRRGGFEIDHCIFDGCGLLDIAQGQISTENFDISYCTFKNGTGTYDVAIRQSVSPATTELRRMNGNVFEGELALFNMRDMVFTNNYIGNDITWGSATYYVDTWESNFKFSDSGTADVPVKAALVKNDFVWASVDNAHLMPYWADGDMTVDGCVFESSFDWSSNESDGFICSANPPAARVYTMKNCVVLPSPGDKSSCTLFTSTGQTNTTWIVENNTFYADDRGAGYIAVHNDGHAGQIQSFRNNLGYGVTPNEAWLLREGGDATPADDLVTVADYNGAYNLNDAYNQVPSNAYASTPGTNDVTTDPSFVDDTRDLVNWGRTILGLTGTDTQVRSNTIQSFKDMNDPDATYYHVDCSVSNLVSWVKDGFAPTNVTDYATSGYGGGYIGAVEPVAAEALTTGILLLMCEV